MKVRKKLKLKEIYEIDGGLFYVEKQSIENIDRRIYNRYCLKTFVSTKKMKLLKLKYKMKKKHDALHESEVKG